MGGSIICPILNCVLNKIVILQFGGWVGGVDYLPSFVLRFVILQLGGWADYLPSFCDSAAKVGGWGRCVV